MLDVLSWGSLLAVDGKTMLTNFLIFAFWTLLSSKDPGFDTYDEYWLATCWSLEAMYEGKWPFKDHKGAGGRMEQGGHRRVLVLADFPADLA